MKSLPSLLFALLAAIMAAQIATDTEHFILSPRDDADTLAVDTVMIADPRKLLNDSLDSLAGLQILKLTEEDYRAVAEELGVEPAAIKAVVEIEAGPRHNGFTAPGVPLINFDPTMFQQYARKNGINLSRYRSTHPGAFQGGGSQKSENRRLKEAMKIDRKTAQQGTFWGMFQIGGFNWKLAGCESLDDFVRRMSRSERDQLELFGNFIRATGLVKHLKAKNWAAFARGYNGPEYARRKYHTRMAAAYERYSRNN